jgi:hypothetical protein
VSIPTGTSTGPPWRANAASCCASPSTRGGPHGQRLIRRGHLEAVDADDRNRALTADAPDRGPLGHQREVRPPFSERRSPLTPWLTRLDSCRGGHGMRSPARLLVLSSPWSPCRRPSSCVSLWVCSPGPASTGLGLPGGLGALPRSPSPVPPADHVIGGHHRIRRRSDRFRHRESRRRPPGRWRGPWPSWAPPTGGVARGTVVSTARASSRPPSPPPGSRLPRVAQDQYDAGPHPGIRARRSRPGDLVFFGYLATAASTTSGIVVQVGEMVDAPHTGAVVRVEPIFSAGYVGATRPAP